MEYLVVKVQTQTASFRIPEFQNFHKSFLLPPPTTIMGFLGAALGVSPKAAQDFVFENNIKIGIYGESGGLAKDLWKYRKKKGAGYITDILTKEVYFNNNYLFSYASSSEIISKIKKAFENPKYALTMGSSDALAKISIIDEFQEIESDEVENCIVEGDVVSKVMENLHNGLEFSVYSTSEPIVYDLPVKFHYKSDYGVRKVTERKKCSFVGKKMKLNINLRGISTDSKFIPMISL